MGRNEVGLLYGVYRKCAIGSHRGETPRLLRLRLLLLRKTGAAVSPLQDACKPFVSQIWFIWLNEKAANRLQYYEKLAGCAEIFSQKDFYGGCWRDMMLWRQVGLALEKYYKVGR